MVTEDLLATMRRLEWAVSAHGLVQLIVADNLNCRTARDKIPDDVEMNLI